jgi:hypothetical protein
MREELRIPKSYARRFTPVTQMRAALLGLVIAVGAVPRAQALGNMEETCQLMRREVEDCGCLVRFLRERLDEEDGLIVLKLLAASKRRLGDPSRAFAEIDREYGQKTLHAMLALFPHTDALTSRCHMPEISFDE